MSLTVALPLWTVVAIYSKRKDWQIAREKKKDEEMANYTEKELLAALEKRLVKKFDTKVDSLRNNINHQWAVFRQITKNTISQALQDTNNARDKLNAAMKTVQSQKGNLEKLLQQAESTISNHDSRCGLENEDKDILSMHEDMAAQLQESIQSSQSDHEAVLLDIKTLEETITTLEKTISNRQECKCGMGGDKTAGPVAEKLSRSTSLASRGKARKRVSSSEKKPWNPNFSKLDIEEQNLLSNAYNDWALQLINEGRYQEAKPFSEKSLEMKHRLLDSGKDQFQFFISKILLAFVLLSEGNVERAPRMAQEALEHIEKEKGPDHPFTLHYKFHIGNVWASIGEYRKALDVHRASVEARTALFGQANHDTLNDHFAIALCLYRLEECMDASARIDKCLAQQQAANWGSEHLLRAKYLHALIMQGLNDTEEDWKMEKELAITERNSLLAEYGGGGKRPGRDRGGTDELWYFDYLVNVHAGRTSFIQLEDC
ncbi:hypothetical protein AK830_g3632 [Neonectria ditissima]|uniref:Uncharacterized protein n=1 Tax=Neonectria ditissima TaxID=78410 RepID=A0A0P7B8E3_9HYPO|nr:hypothetical protein AK830_g3632 [Neonectria ditissima]